MKQTKTNKTQNHTRLKPRDELGLTTQEQVSTLVKVNSTPEPFSKLINEKNRKIRLCKSQIRNTRIDVKKQAWQGIEEATIIERRLLTQLSKKINDILDKIERECWDCNSPCGVVNSRDDKCKICGKDKTTSWDNAKVEKVRTQLSELNLDDKHDNRNLKNN